MNFQDPSDTICAISSPQGMGAISLIRLSGPKSLVILDSIFSKQLTHSESHTAHFGVLKSDKDVLDEVLVTVFKNPNSFTGEDLVEIACHGSRFIQKEILELLLKKGARLAGPGEFSLRAFLNGKMDLSQTEAVADLIASTSEAAHKVAIQQMRGGFSSEIAALRQELMNFASLVELELDFSEEDVEFADRSQLSKLITEIKNNITSLVQSFKFGNVIKNGVPVAIVGAPNAGKSTLLNSFLNEDKAIVSDIAGTTRDVIEDTIILNGIEFRFFDTAGIRDTKDEIESQGIRKAFEKIKGAHIVLLLFDLHNSDEKDIVQQIENFKENSITSDQSLVCLFNKTDKIDANKYSSLNDLGLFISAKAGSEIERLKSLLVDSVQSNQKSDQTVVTNVRHYEVLSKCLNSIETIENGLENQIAGDLLAMDIREALNLLGELTGEVTSDELLGNIFANFCIGK